MKKKQAPAGIKGLTGDVADLSRDLWLAGLGAVATVEEESGRLYDTLLDTGSKRLKDLQDEATKRFEDLVRRGKSFEKKGRAVITERAEAVKEEVEAVKDNVAARQQAIVERVENVVAGSVEKTLEKLDVPTRTEVRSLTEQVERLTKHVQTLAASLEK